jgi:tRNA(Ile2) C34 agmatinyltransferase TiaS
MWPFSHPKCPVCGGTLVPNSGTIGHAAYRCPNCIRNAKLERAMKQGEADT